MKIANKTALKLYECMLRIRHTEETIAERYSEGKMRCPTHLSTGQEAVAAGVCSALRIDDFVLSTHRCHAHYLAKGGNLNKMIAEIYGKATGCTSGKGGSMHLIDKSVGFEGSTSIVGNSIPLAVGLGLSIKLQKTDQVSCVFLGDATIEEGVFFESINFAVLKELPVLFICENNLYSVYSPLNVRQPEDRNIFEMVRGLGIASEHTGGNNCLEVYTKTNTAIENICKGKGPYFIEFDTYRWREHCGPFFDNDLGYRTEKEFLLWKKKDPIVIMETYLLNDSIITEKQLQKMKESAQSEVDKAFDFAEESPFPDPKEALANLYAE
jgi:pyruvate dehydrogenase E1 component alpha subunit